MPTEVVMPEIGETVVSGTIVTWLKQVGDEVKADEPLVEVATDKANVEIPAPASGTLRKILAEEGDEIEVGGLLAIIAAADEELKEAAAERPPAPAKEEKPTEEEPAQPEAAPVETAPTETKPQPEPAAERRRAKSSPLVRRLAREHAVDLAEIEGSGLDGRVTKDDLLDYVAAKGRGEKAAPAKAPAKKGPPKKKPAE